MHCKFGNQVLSCGGVIIPFASNIGDMVVQNKTINFTKSQN